MEKLSYGNWIRKKVLWFLALLTLAFTALAALPVLPVIRVGFAALGLVALVSFLYPFYAYVMFSPRGGNLQNRFYDLILDFLESRGPETILDIGTGNGILAVKAALTNPAAHVIGVDYWGKDWEYSRSVCQQNSQAARVAERLHFQKGNAAALDFPDATFDAVVSNLTFHEVKIVNRKSDVLREALRVLKPGGRFVFIDCFYDDRYYGDPSEFEILMCGLNLEQFELKPLREVIKFSNILKHPRILGKAGIIYGMK